MKEYICIEVPTDNGGYLEIEKEFIQRKNCLWYEFDEPHTCGYIGIQGHVNEYDYCSKAKPKETGK
jgi:hypothetical protein